MALKSPFSVLVNAAAAASARRSGEREPRVSGVVLEPEDGVFEFGAAGAHGVYACVIGCEGGSIAVIQADRPLFSLEKQLIGKRCGPFCDVMGISAPYVSCLRTPSGPDGRTARANRDFFAGEYAGSCAALLKEAWEKRTRGVLSCEDGVLRFSTGSATVPVLLRSRPDLAVSSDGGAIGRVSLKTFEEFAPVTDGGALINILTGRVPAKLRPSGGAVGVILQKGELINESCRNGLRDGGFRRGRADNEEPREDPAEQPSGRA